jgi:hypothetical protein
MVESNGPLLAVAGAVLLIRTRCNRTGTDAQGTGICSGSRLLHEVCAWAVHRRPPARRVVVLAWRARRRSIV